MIVENYRKLLSDVLVDFEQRGLLEQGLSERLDKDPKFIYLVAGLLIDLSHREALGLLKARIREEKNGNLWISDEGEHEVSVLGLLLIRRAVRYCEVGEMEDAGLLLCALKELILSEMKWVEGTGEHYLALVRQLDKTLKDLGFAKAF